MAEQNTQIMHTAEPTPGQLAGILVDRCENLDLDKLAQFMELQERHEDRKAKQAFAEAMVQFRSACPTIKRTGQVEITGRDGRAGPKYTFAQLPQAVEQIQPLMNQCGLAASWTTPEQSPTWIKVTCTVTHVLGHSESTTLGGPPDASGAKNNLQSIKSTWTYLRRVTLFSLLGLVDKDEPDNDGQDGAGRGNSTKPKSEEASQPDEQKAKAEFRQACLDLTGQKDLPGKLLWLALSESQKLSGLTDTSECTAWLRKQPSKQILTTLAQAMESGTKASSSLNGPVTVGQAAKAAVPVDGTPPEQTAQAGPTEPAQTLKPRRGRPPKVGSEIFQQQLAARGKDTPETPAPEAVLEPEPQRKMLGKCPDCGTVFHEGDEGVANVPQTGELYCLQCSAFLE